MKNNSSELKQQADTLAATLSNMSAESDALECATLGWRLRDQTEQALGSDFWLEASDMKIDTDTTGRPIVYSRCWATVFADPGGAWEHLDALAKLKDAVSGTPLDATAPLLAPWQLHAALAHACKEKAAPSAALIGALMRWMPVRRTKRHGSQQLQHYGLPMNADITRRMLAAAAAGMRINDDGFLTRRIGSAEALTAAARSATNAAVDGDDVYEKTRAEVIKSIGGSRQLLSFHEAAGLDENLTRTVETSTAIWEALPVAPLRLEWGTGAADGAEAIWVKPQPLVHRDPENSVEPEGAAVLARWAKPNADARLVRLVGGDDRAAEALCRYLPAMRETDRWELLQTTSGLFEGIGQREACNDAALKAIEAGTRRAVTARRRVKQSGCYLIELHPAAQNGPWTTD